MNLVFKSKPIDLEFKNKYDELRQKLKKESENEIDIDNIVMDSGIQIFFKNIYDTRDYLVVKSNSYLIHIKNFCQNNIFIPKNYEYFYQIKTTGLKYIINSTFDFAKVSWILFKNKDPASRYDIFNYLKILNFFGLIYLIFQICSFIRLLLKFIIIIGICFGLNKKLNFI